MKLYPHNYAEILAALICTVCLFIKPSITNKWFVGFLWLTVCVELTAKLLRHHPAHKMVMYNVFGVIECDFYLLYLSQISRHKLLKALLRVLVVTINTIGIVWWLFIESIKKYSLVVSMIESFLILLTVLTALYSFVSQKSSVPSFKVYLLILMGLLVFYTGNFLPDASAGSSFSETHSQTFITVYRLVNGYLNVFMYSCFSLAFITEISNKPINSTDPS